MYLEHKAGSYIDLMCDLTRYNTSHHRSYNHSKVNNSGSHHSNNGSINGHLFTMSTGGRGNPSSKQNSPSPSVSSLSRSSMVRHNLFANQKKNQLI